MATPDPQNARNVTQFLTFNVCDEEYGIDILRVQEIKGHTPLTPIPNSPSSVKGVMNLRGAVVPVIGLRETFGMASVAYGKFSVIIVVTVGARVVGLIVDAVSEVVDLTPDAIDMTPELGCSAETALVQGMGRADDKFIILLDVERVVSGLERPSAGSAATGSDAAAAAAGQDNRAA